MGEPMGIREEAGEFVFALFCPLSVLQRFSFRWEIHLQAQPLEITPRAFGPPSFSHYSNRENLAVSHHVPCPQQEAMPSDLQSISPTPPRQPLATEISLDSLPRSRQKLPAAPDTSFETWNTMRIGTDLSACRKRCRLSSHERTSSSTLPGSLPLALGNPCPAPFALIAKNVACASRNQAVLQPRYPKPG
jgi:hypothetical protein